MCNTNCYIIVVISSSNTNFKKRARNIIAIMKSSCDSLSGFCDLRAKLLE